MPACNFGICIQLIYGSLFPCPSMSQAHGFWQWRDFLVRRAVLSGRQPLLVNLDETSVCRALPDAKGLIVSKRWWPGTTRPSQDVSRKDPRSYVSHVAMCTHRSDIQPLLPQIFTGNWHIFTLPLMAALAAAALPPAVKFWRQKSSWNTSALMLDILQELSAALAHRPIPNHIGFGFC